MKKRTKIILGIAIPIILITGRIFMTQRTPFDIFLTRNYAKEAEQTSREGQINYLKRHEKEMTEFVIQQNKTQSPEHQITSVQWDWESLKIVNGGGPIQSSIVLYLNGRFNNIKDSEFTINFPLQNEVDIPNIRYIYMLDPSFRIKGGSELYD